MTDTFCGVSQKYFKSNVPTKEAFVSTLKLSLIGLPKTFESNKNKHEVVVSR